MNKVRNILEKFFVFFVFPFSTMIVTSLALPKKLLAQFEGNVVGGETGASNGGTSTGSNTTTYKIDNPLSGVNDIGSFIKKILDIVLTIGIPIVALFIIYSGFLFVTARGNSEKLGDAKKTLGYTLLGAAILLGSWIIAQALGETVKQLQ
jgi:hypothetical protein